MANLFDFVHPSFKAFDPSMLLKETTSAILGVTNPVNTALQEVGISTVFDLATSEVFANAVNICLLASGGQGWSEDTGQVPPGILSEGYDLPVDDLPLRSVSILSTHFSKIKLENLETAIGIATIQGLAAWVPYATARNIFNRVYNPMPDGKIFSADTTSVLAPATGTPLTEALHFAALLMDKPAVALPKINCSNIKPGVNENITCTLTGIPASVQVNWVGGGNPATGTGLTFTTRFGIHGLREIKADFVVDGKESSSTLKVQVQELSGAQWVNLWQKSTDIDDLAEPFRQNVKRFMAALENAQAEVALITTFRPPERSYLMFYAKKIFVNNMPPQEVPASSEVNSGDVNICWTHRDASGNPDLVASKKFAQQLYDAYGINGNPVALHSKHNLGLAIDVKIYWSGDLSIVDGNGKKVIITSLPKNGGKDSMDLGNKELHAIGASYGVIKLYTDAPHWSDDGS